MLIELYVQEHGPCSVDEIHTDLDVPKLTLYPVTRRLVNETRVERNDDGELHGPAIPTD